MLALRKELGHFAYRDVLTGRLFEVSRKDSVADRVVALHDGAVEARLDD